MMNLFKEFHSFENKNLEALTIQDLLNDTGISRQTFYNHFIDKNDLIHYVYNTKIVPDFHYQNMTINFYEQFYYIVKKKKKAYTKNNIYQ